jgi:acyl dehydratase
VIEVPTLPQQATLYRHSGDDNPLHLDPEYARAGGFEQPILQGLCSLGLAVRVLTDVLFGGDPGAASRVAARFTGTVVPGQTLRVAAWRLDDCVAFEAGTVEGVPVLGLGFLA